jgi:predicted O-methyltransferase YrrM
MEPGETPLKFGPASVEETRERIEPLLVLPHGGNGLELGVEWGVHADLLLQVAKPKHLTLVDVWYDPERYGVVLDRFRGREDVTIRRQKTQDVVKEFHDGSFDWIFVDANHEYGAVRADALSYYPKLKWGGYMLMHDMWIDNTRKGILSALDKLPHLHYVALGRDRLETLICRKVNTEGVTIE